MKQCIKFLISGTVQGVGFRYFSYRQAIKLGITGYVRNLEDGRVELVAYGDKLGLTSLNDWLKQGGPTSARVTDIEQQSLPNQSYIDFTIR